MRKSASSLSVLAVLLAPAAFAGGTWTSVTVVSLEPVVGTNGYVEVQLSANSTGNPTCSNNNKNHAIVDVSTPSGAFAAGVLQGVVLSRGTKDRADRELTRKERAALLRRVFEWGPSRA